MKPAASIGITTQADCLIHCNWLFNYWKYFTVLARVGRFFFDPNFQLFPDTYDNFIEKKFCPSSHRPNPSPGDQSQYLWMDQSECCHMLSSTRLGQIWKTLYFQLFLGRPCICKPKKLHSSPQKSKPKPGACLEVGSLDQSQTRAGHAGLWLVQTCFFKSSSGPGVWLLCWTMQLFRLTYSGSSQK